jgi:hypothetical protein
MVNGRTGEWLGTQRLELIPMVMGARRKKGRGAAEWAE